MSLERLIKGSSNLERLHKQLVKSCEEKIHVGIQGNPELATRLAVNEYGVGVKERPAVRRFVRKEKRRGFKGGLVKVAKRMTLEEGISRKDKATLGEVTAEKLKQAIVGLRSPQNSPETIEQKGGRSNPLVDSGETVGAITSWIGEEK